MNIRHIYGILDTTVKPFISLPRGPNPDILSEFKYNRIQGTAEAKLYSMFKFPESNRVHFQCDIVVCKGNLKENKAKAQFNYLNIPDATD